MWGILCAVAVGCAVLAGCRSGNRAFDAGTSLDRQIETGGWAVLADVPEPRPGGAAAVGFPIPEKVGCVSHTVFLSS